MKSSSIKAKGRRTQNLVAGVFHLLGTRLFGLQKGDVEPRPMGQAGVDVIFSPRALGWFPFDVECKTVEKLNVVGEYTAHRKQYENTDRFKILVHGRNNSDTLVTMSLVDFMEILFRDGDYGYGVIAKAYEDANEHKNSWDAIKNLDDKKEVAQ